MNMLDFISRGVIEIAEKQAKALDDFCDGILNFQVSSNPNYPTSDIQAVQVLSFDQNKVFHDPQEDNLQLEYQIQGQQKGLLFFQIIANKNARAFDEFFSQLDKLHVDTKSFSPLRFKMEPQGTSHTEVKQILTVGQNQVHHDPSEEYKEYTQHQHLFQGQSKGLFFVQKIANKMAIGLDDFISQLNKVQVDKEAITPLTFKMEKTIKQNPLSKPMAKQLKAEQKKILKQTLISQQYQKSAEYHRTHEVKTPKRRIVLNKESQNYYYQKNQLKNPQDLQDSEQEKSKTASEILAQLEQIHRQRSIQRLQKSNGHTLKKRTRIIRIGNDMQQIMREKRQKQAEQKIKINIDFLERIKIKPSKQLPSFKEFKNSTSEKFDKLQQSIRIKTIKKTVPYRRKDQEFYLMNGQKKYVDLGSSVQKNSNGSNIFVDTRIKLPQIQVKKGAPKPKPYSIYNVTQRANEIFINR